MSSLTEIDYYPIPVLVPQRPPVAERKPAPPRRYPSNNALSSTHSSLNNAPMLPGTPTSVSSSSSGFFPSQSAQHSTHQVQYAAPYLQTVRLSKEVQIYRPPSLLGAGRAGLGSGRTVAAPQIMVQTEQNASNFHEISKNAFVDPETQLTIPTWELRTPSPEELAEEKEFEAAEAQWEDEYWKRVAAFRQRMKITPKQERHSHTSSTGGTSSSRRASQVQISAHDAPSDKTFSRGDSYRMDSKVPAAAVAPAGVPAAKKRKPALPAAATSEGGVRSKPQSKPSSMTHLTSSTTAAPRRMADATKRSTSTQSLDSSAVDEPITAPSTPLHFHDNLTEETSSVHTVPDATEPAASASAVGNIPRMSLASLSTVTPVKDGATEHRVCGSEGVLTPPQLTRGKSQAVKHPIHRDRSPPPPDTPASVRSLVTSRFRVSDEFEGQIGWHVVPPVVTLVPGIERGLVKVVVEDVEDKKKETDEQRQPAASEPSSPPIDKEPTPTVTSPVRSPKQVATVNQKQVVDSPPEKEPLPPVIVPERKKEKSGCCVTM